MPNMRKIDLEVETPVKPKREITEAQREHLNKIRLLAMAKKAELKEITLKSKLAKTVPKKELAEQYDNYVAQKAVQTHANAHPLIQKAAKAGLNAAKTQVRTQAVKSTYNSVVPKV